MANIREDDMETTLPARTTPSPLAPATSARLVEAFFAGRNERTVRAYRQDLKDFSRFAGVDSVEEAAALLVSRGPGEGNALALAYRADLVERGLAAATVNRRLAALRSVVKLARTLGAVAWSLEVPSLKAEPYRDTRGPGRGGVHRLLEALEQREDGKAVRDRALLRLLYDLGLRRGEVVSLDVAHLDLEEGTLSVLGKGRTGREKLTLPSPTAEALHAWLEVRGEEPGALFTNYDRAGKGSRLTGTSLYRLVRKLAGSAGFRATPHGLRHAAITEALDATGGDVRAVQKFSRHRDLRVLNRYDDSRQDMAGEVAALVAGGV